MKWRVINASVRGSAHQRTGMPNQDAVDYGIASKEQAAATVLAVSDGHGGGRHFRSQVGSTLAVHVAVKIVKDAMARPVQGDGWLIPLGQEIVEGWSTAVQSDLANNPFTEEELTALEQTDGGRVRESVLDRPELAYGATLLIAAATDTRMVYMQLGDGDILAVDADGTTTRPIEADERLVGNQTTSLCQPEAWREFRTAEVRAGAGLPVLVLLSTDGYVNSFQSQEDFLQIGKDYLDILREQGSDVLAEELPRILTEATQQGSGDDITLGMLHAEVLPAATAVAKEAAAKSAPGTTKSVMIRELTKERSTQQKKMTELESDYAGVRRHVLQLRLMIGAVVLVAVAALTQQHWLPWLRGTPVKKSPGMREPVLDPNLDPTKRPVRGKPVKDGPGGEPAIGTSPEIPGGSMPQGDKPAAGSPSIAGPDAAAGDWVLVMSGGSEIVLTAGATISSDKIVPDEPKHAYAKVKKADSNMILKNLSSDAWTAIVPTTGKRSTFGTDDNLTLRPDTKITFSKSVTGTITFRAKSS